MRFGRWIFVSTVLTFLAGQSDRLVFGKMIPIALFGVYSIASMLAALPTQAVLKLGGAVIFPAPTAGWWAATTSPASSGGCACRCCWAAAWSSAAWSPAARS